MIEKKMVRKREDSRFTLESSKILPRSKRSQVTVFIIIALVILVIFIFLFSREGPENVFVEKSPFQEVEECAKVPLEEGLEIVSFQGGSISPENYFLFENKKVDYLCYTDENFKSCVVQKPILINSIRNELEDFVKPRVKNCLRLFEETYENKGYDISMKEPLISVELVPDNVIIDLDLDLRISKDGTESYDHVRSGIKSKIYNFVMIGSSIMSYEIEFGDSDPLTYMLYYPSMKVEKKKQSESTKVYILTDRESDEKFYFAIKSYVVPPGTYELE